MPSHRFSATTPLLGALLLLVACTDQLATPATGPAELQRDVAASMTSCTESSSPEELIDCLFTTPGLRKAAQRQLDNILRMYDRGQVEVARGMMFDLIDFTLTRKDEGQLLDPQPLGQARVVSLLFDGLFQAVGLEPPEVPDGALEEDGAVGIVSPLGGTVATGTRLFGVAFAENAVDRDVLMTMERLPDDDGPLPTDLAQYGPFYKMTVSPGVDEISGVTTGLCYYREGPLAPPDDPAARAWLRIARTVPGTNDEIKILDLATAPSFLDCSDVTQVASLRRRDARILARLGEEVSSLLVRVLEPSPLGAQTQGGQTDTILVRGGAPPHLTTYSISYASVMSGPLPDLIVASVEVSPAAPVEGEDVSIEVIVENVGDGDAGASTLEVEKEPDVFYGTASIPALAAGASYTTTLVGPLDAGVYDDVVATADAWDKVTEEDETNNTTTFSFTVAEAPPATISGHVYVDGDPVPDANVVSLTGSGGTLGAMTNGAGVYQFANLDPGTYTVSVAATGYFAESSKEVTVAAGEDATVDFDGAYLYTAPEGTGAATTWTLAEPDVTVGLCNGEGSDPCEYGSTVTLRAVATGPSGTFVNPWIGGRVYFYYHHVTTGDDVYIGRVEGSSATVIDDGISTRYWTWTLEFDATGVPAGTLELTAVGTTSGQAYRTPVNCNVAVVPGT